MAPPSAPCSWDPIPCGCELPGYDPDESPGAEPSPSVTYAVEMSQFVVWALSGRQFGLCEITVRPCRRDCWQGLDGSPWGARLIDGQWINLPCRSCAGRCSCNEICEVRLPHAPAAEIVEVIMNGVPLEAGKFRLDDGEWLVLDPSAGCFPDCQDMGLTYGEAGTWGYTYKYGSPPPTAGRMAVGSLACEILKGCDGDDECKLPKRTQSIVQQGLAVQVIDPFEFFDKGLTGIYEVDLFIRAVNPEGRPSAARILSPDMDERPRQTWP